MCLLYVGWGAGLLDGGTRFRVYWVGSGVYMGVYCANLSIVQFRAMILGIHVINIYPPQISCVRQLIKPNIVYKDTTGMTNHMIMACT